MARPPRTPGMQALEQRHGRPLEDVLQELAAEGVSQREAGSRLGVSRKTFADWIGRLGMTWPCGHAWASAQRWRRDAVRKVRVGDELLPIAEAARRRGIPAGTVQERWQQGDRTAKRLLRPINANHDYQLGLSMADWDLILAYALERGADAAAKKFGIPRGAVNLMLQGHQEWVA